MPKDKDLTWPINCRICQGETESSYRLHSSTYHLEVQTYYCRSCNAFFSNGAPVNYERIEDFDLVTYYLRYEPAIRLRYKKIFSFVEALVPPGRFLDVGSGMGFSLDIGVERGWRSSGVEPNPVLANQARARGLDVDNSYLNGAESGEYDFILIDNVLEHILHPVDFLKNSIRLLKPSGVMMIAVPPMDWLRQGLSSNRWVRERLMIPQINIFYDADQHVNMFSRTAMKRLLESVGMRLLPIRWHHSRAYDNALFRSLGLDDGYYFVVKA